MEKTKKPYKTGFFKGCHAKCEKSKNGFLAKIAWHYLCQARIFVATICFGQNFFWTKTVQSRKHYKNRGFSGIAKRQKWHLFWCFLTWLKKWVFSNCVFEKLCFPENTIFIVFSAKHSFSKTKTVCWKNRKFMKNSGLFLKMAKWCFGGFFSGFNITRFVFGVSGIVSKVLKNACFPQFLWLLFFIWVWKV